MTAITLLATYHRNLSGQGAVSAKRRDVLKLRLDEYRRFAVPIENGLVNAAKLLTRAKIYDTGSLPYQTQLIPWSAICAFLDSAFESDVVKKSLARWYWCGVFGELYGGANEARFANDIQEVLPWLNGGPDPRTIKDSNVAPIRLLTLQSRLSAAYKGLAAQLMQAGSADFISGDAIELNTYYVPVSTLTDHKVTVRSVIFSSDTRYIATASDDNTARLWDLPDGKMRYKVEHTPDQQPTYITSIAFSPDSRWLATAGWDKQVKIWNTATGRLEKELPHNDQIVNIVAFHPKKQYVFTGGDEGAVRMWDLNINKSKPVKKFSGMGVITELALAANGNRVAASDKSSVKLWDFSTGAELRLLPRSDTPTTSIAFTPDGAWLAITSEQGTVNLWNSTPGEQLCTFVSPRKPAVTRVAFNQDATRLAVAYDDGTSQVIERGVTCPTIYSLKHGPSEAPVTQIAFSPDGRMLATAGIDKTVKIWDAGPKPEAKTPLATLRHRSEVASVAFSPDSKRVVSVTSDGLLMMWDSEMKSDFANRWSRDIGLTKIPNPSISSRAQPPGQLGKGTHFSVSRTFDMTFSKDGTQLSMIDPSGNPSTWDVATGEPKQIIDSRNAPPDASATGRAVAISSQGKLVATVDGDEATVRDPTKPDEKRKIEHDKTINALAFSPDGKRLATASDDGQTIVSDVVTGDKVFALPGQSGRVRTVAFSPNGKWIATVEEDNNIRIYAADIEELENLSRDRLERPMTPS